MTTQITPKSWLSWDVTTYDESRSVAGIALNRWRDTGEVTIGDATYRADRETSRTRAFVLAGADGVIARAEKASVFRHQLVIRHADHGSTLRRRSIFRLAFVVLDGSQEIFAGSSSG